MALHQIGENRMMDYKSRMIELKRRNTIINLKRQWEKESINIELTDFLEVQETLQLQDNIMNKLKEMDTNNICIINREDDSLEEFTKVLLSRIDERQIYAFFVGEANEIGALLLKGDIILEKYRYIIMQSELFNEGCSIFFCQINMKSGICFWKGEYDNRIYIW